MGVNAVFIIATMASILPLMLTEFQVQNSTTKLMMTSHLSFPHTVIYKKVSRLYFNYSFIQDVNQTMQGIGWLIIASLDNDKTARLLSETEFYIHPNRSTGSLHVSVEGILPGRNMLYFYGKDFINKSHASTTTALWADTEKYGRSSWPLYIERIAGELDTGFNIVVVLLVVTANIGMGAKVDQEIVKAHIKRPFAPIIGLSSQFIFMPLIAFTVAYNINIDPGMALGLFTLGCSPGGSASNAYTFLLDGNVSLSITMTLISTLASLGLLPMWLFTLGRVVYHDARVKIPYQNIFISLVGILLPVSLGLLLQRKCPKVANMFVKTVKYVMTVFVLFVLTVGVYANVYIFYLLNGHILLAGALVPYLGFIMGGLAAFILRQDLANIITIAVETGIQNTGIPIILLRLSLLGPDKDTSIVMPVVAAIFTPIPMVIAIFFVQTRKFLKRRGGQRDTEVNEPAAQDSTISSQHQQQQMSLTTADVPDDNTEIYHNTKESGQSLIIDQDRDILS